LKIINITRGKNNKSGKKTCTSKSGDVRQPWDLFPTRWLEKNKYYAGGKKIEREKKLKGKKTSITILKFSQGGSKKSDPKKGTSISEH
jgi:hypothetical protein